MTQHHLTKAVIGAVLFTLFSPAMQAQVLEEVVVTAQRREQLLREVPISIEAYGGSEIQRQGYRNLRALSDFSPSVLVDDSGYLSQERMIRGFGTSGNALTLEQAVPIFIDGIHYGRPSQVKTAFLDLDRVEVLKGPQPVFFGMSATAGAFNIQSRKPTPVWEGYVDTEFGNNGKAQAEAAAGGPLTDTFGIRVAGKYEDSDGFLEDIVHGGKLGSYRDLGGRVTFQWTPTDVFKATLKAEGSMLDKDPEATHLCRTDGNLKFFQNPSKPSDEGDERSVWVDPPLGSGWDEPHQPLSRDCFGNNAGVSNGGPFHEVPLNVAEENSTTGMIDVREAMDTWVRLLDERGFGGSSKGIQGTEQINSWTGYLDLVYTLSNGVEVDWLTGYSYYDRVNVRDNSNSPFLLNLQDRTEKFNQWSSELRFTSPDGGHDFGGFNLEWMLGLFIQDMDYDINSNSPRGNARRGLRYNEAWEDQTWKSAFATVTFNFLDDRASIDLGGRYQDLNKDGMLRGWGAQWVFDVKPCAPTDEDYLGGGNFDPDTCPLHKDAIQISEADTEFLLPGADVDNLWILGWKKSKEAPSSWRGSRANAVGLSALDPSFRKGEGPWTPDNGMVFDAKEFDPQVTLRYRLGNNHSLFARWAQAFKAGGFDTGVSSINQTLEDLVFKPENAETWEVGSKGNLLDGRARYDIALFWTVFNDFQISVPTGIPDDPYLNVNAGQQRVRGAEFNTTMAVTDQLTMSLSGALMDGEMTYFPAGGCTTEERVNFEQSGCDPDTGRIDRTGAQAPRTPDWKFVLTLDYWMTVLDDYRASFNAKGYISDGYLTDINGFSQTVRMDQHEDLNLTLGFGDIDDVWEVSAWGRNILERRQTYHPEFDIFPGGTQSGSMSPSQFFTYGVKFRYNFR